MVGLSHWTSTKPTPLPPGDSPTPEEMMDWRRERVEGEVGHQEVVQRVRRGWREEEERRVRVSNSEGVRTLADG